MSRAITDSAFHAKFSGLQTVFEAMADADHQKYREEMMKAGYTASLDKYGNEIWSLEDWQQADKEQHPMAALPANIDPSPLIEKYGPQRKDFDRMRDDIAAIRPQQMTATINGKELAELAADYDHRAKAYIDEADKAFKPLEDAARDTLNKIRDLHSNIIGTAQQVRVRARELLSAHQMSIQRKIDDERREAERKQRELAEAERAAQLAELRARQEEAHKTFDRAGDAAAREEAGREEARLAAEASEVAAQPPVPAAVSTTALAEKHAVSGVSGTKVYLRTIRTGAKAFEFLRWAMGQAISVTIPKEKRNVVILMFAGIEATINFSGRRKDDAAIPGVELESTVDTYNRRK